MVDTLKRLKQFEISRQMLSLLLQEEQIFAIEDGVPQDVEIVDSGYDREKQLFYLTLHHESFDEVHEGEKIPYADVQLTQLTETDIDEQLV